MWESDLFRGVMRARCYPFDMPTLPIKGPMEEAGVIKLYEPSPTPCLYVAPVQNMAGRVPLIQLFLAGNATPTFPYLYSKRRESGSLRLPDGLC